MIKKRVTIASNSNKLLIFIGEFDDILKEFLILLLKNPGIHNVRNKPDKINDALDI